MAVRHNLCPNPAAGNDITGWTGNSTGPARVDATGLGFPRDTAASFTDGSIAVGPAGAVTPGVAYTVSVYLRPVNFPINGTLFIEWLDGGGNSIGFEGVAFSAPNGVVTRINQSGVAAAGAQSVHFVVSGENYASNPAYYTAHLAEQGAELGDYFDGDSPDASWDGTPGSSTSTLNDAVAITAVMDLTLPALTAHLAGTVTVEGVMAVVLPALRVAVTGTSDVVPVRPGTMSPRERPGATAAPGQRAGATAAATERRATRMEGGA